MEWVREGLEGGGQAGVQRGGVQVEGGRHAGSGVRQHGDRLCPLDGLQRLLRSVLRESIKATVCPFNTF
eukprot:1181221-Prorocentrum_minimum.AAC.4